MNPSMSAASSLQALAANIDAVLPQTQCTRCGYPDCAAYADAIAREEAPINQCPPGGAEGVARLAAITGRPVLPLSAEHGLEAPRTVAVIDEAWCIGCTLCIKACPTDAILGANKRMHVVIATHCTGCELCIPVCPVDCIELINVSGQATGWNAWSPSQAEHARTRYARRQQRLAADKPAAKLATAPSQTAQASTTSAPVATSAEAEAPKVPAHVPAPETAAPDTDASANKKATIAAILAKARAQRPPSAS